MKLAYLARWYAKDGTIRESYFERLKDARAEARRHKDAEVFKREPAMHLRPSDSDELRRRRESNRRAEQT